MRTCESEAMEGRKTVDWNDYNLAGDGSPAAASGQTLVDFILSRCLEPS